MKNYNAFRDAGSASSTRHKQPGEHLLDLYKRMLRIRMVEEAIAARYHEQEMRCPVHLSVGQEGPAVAVCAALRPDDVIVSTHRSHAHYLACGGDLRSMLAEIYGKESGCSRGRGGSMHLIDRAAGLLAALPIVGGSIPIGVGAALAKKRDGSDAVSVVFVGDAALEEGVFHESANFASMMKLPVVFACENNLYSVYTPYRQRQPNRPLTRLAEAHDIRTFTEDGNDIEAALERSHEAVAHARSGAGPAFLEMATYRWLEHCGPNYDNDIGYRTPDEFESWRALCPVATARDRLLERGDLDDDSDEELKLSISTEIEAAFEFARQSPFPAAESAADYVYA